MRGLPLSSAGEDLELLLGDCENPFEIGVHLALQCGRSPLEAVEKEEGRKSDALVKAGAVKGVGDELCERGDGEEGIVEEAQAMP